MTSLKGKTRFISGASRGIGLAIALRAARDGANVAIAAKTTDAHPKLTRTIHTAAAAVEAARGHARAARPGGGRDRGRGWARAGLPGRRARRAPDRGRGGAHGRPLRRYRH